MADLISPSRLADLAQAPSRPVLLDVRWSLTGPDGASLYQAGHLPEAVFVDLDRELAGTPGRHGRHPLPDVAALEVSMRRWGLRDGGAVVVYDAADATSAARAWWLLRWAGVQDVRVLDGGLAAWHAAGLPVVTDVVVPPPGDIRARPAGMRVLDAEAAADLARTGVLLDARAAERYAGTVEPIDPVAGHIPGARSAPTGGNVDQVGRFLPTADLHARFVQLGVTGQEAVGAYCGSGVTAAHEVLALRLAGIEAALYVGSWSEWVTDPTRPVATGSRPWGADA